VLRILLAIVHQLLDRTRTALGALKSARSLQAENLFLRAQLGLYVARNARPVRPTPLVRLRLAALAWCCDWRRALVVVQPRTLLRWHRLGFRLLWRRRSLRPGRPALPQELRRLITAMVRENPSWGEERIAAELRLKLGLRVSPRSVRRYWPGTRSPRGAERGRDQRWGTFVRNHADAIVACDFFTSVTATFRVLYVLIVMEVGSRRVIHCGVTANPSTEWTIRHLRVAIPYDHRWRFLIHDRHATFSARLDQALTHMRLQPLRTPARAPKANAFCERLIGSLRRECLDWMIPLGEAHLRRMLGEWVRHYNAARPHSSLGPGIPDPPGDLPVAFQHHRHRLPPLTRVASTPVLGGLHHEYRLEDAA